MQGFIIGIPGVGCGDESWRNFTRRVGWLYCCHRSAEKRWNLLCMYLFCIFSDIYISITYSLTHPLRSTKWQFSINKTNLWNNRPTQVIQEQLEWLVDMYSRCHMITNQLMKPSTGESMRQAAMLKSTGSMAIWPFPERWGTTILNPIPVGALSNKLSRVRCFAI